MNGQKKIFRYFLIMICFFVLISNGSGMVLANENGTAAQVNSTTDMFQYEISNGFYVPNDTIIIKNYDKDKNPSHPSVVIPNEIEGKPVTMIYLAAFKNKELKNITIPDSVTYIAENAFSGNLIETIKLPSQLELISSSAFYNNKNLKSISIPDSVTEIKNDAFRDCALESVKLPKNLRSLGGTSFTNNKIKSIVIPGTVGNNGGYWDAQSFCNNALETVVIEEGVTAIPDDFYNEKVLGDECNNHISSLTLPSTLNSIGYQTFYGQSLAFITLPENINKIGKYAFQEQGVSVDYILRKDSNDIPLFKNMDLSKLTIETEGVFVDSKTRLASVPKKLEDIEYKYNLGTFKGVESFLTGILKLENGTAKIKFLDYDDSVLEEIDALMNETVKPSKTPTRDGYTFIGWDKSLENIIESQDIKAQYKRLPEITMEDKLIKVGDDFNPLKDVKTMDADGNEIKDIKVIENTVNTTKEGTYYVTLEVSDQWGGKTTKQYKVIVEKKYIDRTVKDQESNISIEGNFTKDANVIVELTNVGESLLNNKIKDKKLINAFEIHVVGEYQGKLKIRFPLDNETNGTKIYIYHEKSNGEIEEFERIVNNGFVEITVDELSPFVLARDKVQQHDIKPNEATKPGNKPNNPNDKVQTGDETNIGALATLFVSTGLIAFVVKRRSTIRIRLNGK